MSATARAASHSRGTHPGGIQLDGTTITCPLDAPAQKAQAGGSHERVPDICYPSHPAADQRGAVCCSLTGCQGHQAAAAVHGEEAVLHARVAGQVSRACTASFHWLGLLGTHLFSRRHGVAQLQLQALCQRHGSQALGQQGPKIEDGGGRDCCARYQQAAGAICLGSCTSSQQVGKAGRCGGPTGCHLQLLRSRCSLQAVRGDPCVLQAHSYSGAARRCCCSQLHVKATAAAAAGQ